MTRIVTIEVREDQLAALKTLDGYGPSVMVDCRRCGNRRMLAVWGDRHRCLEDLIPADKLPALLEQLAELSRNLP